MTEETRDYIVATYQVEEKFERLEKRAESIAIGLTVGSWTDLPQTKQEAVKAHCGRVLGVEVTGEGEDGRVVANLSIGYPIRNFTVSIPSILTTVFGKLSLDGKIRLVKLELPDAFVARFPGAKYGISGIRERVQVVGRPLLMSIFKSCIGHDLQSLTGYFIEQALGGVDFIKDDEIFFTEEYATPEQRTEAFVRASAQVLAETGKQVHYAVNLTGPTSGLIHRARRLSDLGAGALLFNVFAYGYDVLQELAADSRIQVPIMAHPAVSGALFGAPNYGLGPDIVLGKLLRLAGADIVIYPAAYGSVTLSVEEGSKLAYELRKPLPIRESFPCPSAGVHPGMVHRLVQDLGIDFIVNAGGGIHGHPGGPTAGGKAFCAAIDAAVQNVDPFQAAKASPELKQALDKWGCVSA